MKHASIALGGTLAAALFAWGCNDITGPGGDVTGGAPSPADREAIITALNADDLTAFGYTGSDWEDDASFSGAPGLQQFAVNARWFFRREVASAARTINMTGTGDSVSVSIVEDRTGTLRVRDEHSDSSHVEVSRPFADHGERTAMARRGERGRWLVYSTSFMDRASTSVANPIGIAYIEFNAAGGPSYRFDSATELYDRSQWPSIKPGTVVTVSVRIENVPEGGGRVFLHDWYDHHRHQVELLRDPSDPTLFTTVWHATPWRFSERLFRRLLTVDAFDAATISTQPDVPYNAHQWVLPVSVTELGTRGPS